MDFQDLLAPVAGEFDVEEALESWRWLVPDQVSSLAVTAFGDLFLIGCDHSISFLDTISGTSKRVAASVMEWEQRIREPKNLDEWFMPGFIEVLREAGRYLSQGECYTALHEIVLGGTWSIENFQPMHWRVHFHSAGQVLRQLKDLSPGTRITGIKFQNL